MPDKSGKVLLDVPYGGGSQGNLCVDLYLPAGSGPHAALLCLHGGAWLHGSQRQYESWGPWLADKGYAVVAAAYRLSNEVSPAWPGVWDDICLSLNWLIANAPSLNIDTGRTGTIGDSVGGLMAAMLALDERTASHIRAVVGVSGVYDLPKWWRVRKALNGSEDPWENSWADLTKRPAKIMKLLPCASVAREDKPACGPVFHHPRKSGYARPP